MTDPARPSAVETAQGLTGALEEMSGELRKVSRQNRLTRWLVVAVLAVAVVAAVAVYLAATASARAAGASGQARAVSASNLALCQAGNTARAQQVQLWDYVLSLSTPPKTAQGRKVIGEFEMHLRVLFAPRNCAALGKQH